MSTSSSKEPQSKPIKNNFLIFTKRVLPLSNTFVANQARYLNKFDPVFIGFSRDRTGAGLVVDKQACVLEDFSSFPKWDKFLLEGFGKVPAKWKSALAEFNPKFIHAHFGKGGFYASSIAEALSIPLIVTFHGSDITEKDKFSYNQKHRNLVFEKADKIIASSNFIAEKLLQKGCPEEKLQTHYIGIDNQFFSPTHHKSEKPTIAFVGRLIEQKGCHFLLQAMEIVNQKVPEAKLLIAGDGVQKNNLKSMAKNLKNIEFLGSQDPQQVKELLGSAWLMCAPSIVLKRGNEEGLGMVFLEAQAMGTPVVSFETGGVSEAVENDKTGILVKEKSVNDLAEAIISILQSKSKRESLAQQGIARIDSVFNLARQTQTFEKIYASL